MWTLCLTLLTPAAALPQDPVGAPREPADPSREAPGKVDLRGYVLLRLDCASELRRREVTLFGNGTVRLRDGVPGEEEMLLAELSPEELEGYVARLDQEDLSETDPAPPAGVTGEWVEHCELELNRFGRQGERFAFGRYDSLSLALSRVLAVARGLEDRAEEARSYQRLPSGYEPRIGDRLLRLDGAVFEVTGFTMDEQGVELQGVDQPITLYILIGQLGERFVEVLPEGEW